MQIMGESTQEKGFKCAKCGEITRKVVILGINNAVCLSCSSKVKAEAKKVLECQTQSQ